VSAIAPPGTAEGTPPPSAPPAATQPPRTAAPKTPAPGLAPFKIDVPGTTLSLEMAPVPPGSSDRPVEAEKGFWISRHEITWDLYDTFVYRLDQGGADDAAGADAITRPSKPYISMDRGYGHSSYPAISMSYHGAESFCEWLSKKTGRRFRLPTEAEWKAICRRSGIDPANASEHAWHAGNADRTTHPVGTKRADALGLYDLWGNASEWCTGAEAKPVTIGGSFLEAPDRIGCAAVVPPVPDWNASDPQFPKSIWWLADAGFVGFRVVCEPE
jgi:formylglycine-generating enzyme required for sulfatase activity